ncbi:MAG: Abortive infection protein [Clostridia bacterium]|nr:Abortive infection protein [Clostridia bacterium]
MNKLREKKPILHGVIWIIFYIVMVNIGDGLSELAGVPNLATSAILIIFSITLVLYLKKNNWFEAYGMKGITKKDLPMTLFYVPLIVLAFIQYFAGIDNTLSMMEIAASCLLMIGVGFIEELIFRGFLFQGIYAKSGENRAILISGITFGIGHIVNLLRGYSLTEQMGQIIVAIAIGIALALLVAITKNIVPGILFHIAFNISGTITKADSNLQIYLTIAILSISTFYAIYLFRSMHSKNKVASSNNPSML